MAENTNDPGDDLQCYMMSFCTRPEARDELPSRTQQLVDAAAVSNRSAKWAIYAFLDEAHGNRDWFAYDVKAVVLRDVRAYDLRSRQISEPWHIDGRYGAFWGSGDPSFLQRVVNLEQQEPTHPLHEAAWFSLSSLCKQDPHFAAAVRECGGSEMSS